eukprot:365319-Chlamydomonas_euryale.AAC.24
MRHCYFWGLERLFAPVTPSTVTNRNTGQDPPLPPHTVYRACLAVQQRKTERDAASQPSTRLNEEPPPFCATVRLWPPSSPTRD